MFMSLVLLTYQYLYNMCIGTNHVDVKYYQRLS
jgi:hypothetical protein